MEPEEMKALVIETKRAWQSLGKVNYIHPKSMLPCLPSFVLHFEDMKKGDILQKIIYELLGQVLKLPPKYYQIFLKNLYLWM